MSPRDAYELEGARLRLEREVREREMRAYRKGQEDAIKAGLDRELRAPLYVDEPLVSRTPLSCKNKKALLT